MAKRIIFFVGTVMLSTLSMTTPVLAQTAEETVAFLLFGYEEKTRTSLELTTKIYNNTWESWRIRADARGTARAFADNLSKAEVETYFESSARIQIVQRDTCRYVVKWENLEVEDIDVVVGANFSGVHDVSVTTNGPDVIVSLVGGTIRLGKVPGRSAKTSTAEPTERDEPFVNGLFVPVSHLAAGTIDAYAARLKNAAAYLRSQFCKGRAF